MSKPKLLEDVIKPEANGSSPPSNHKEPSTKPQSTEFKSAEPKVTEPHKSVTPPSAARTTPNAFQIPSINEQYRHSVELQQATFEALTIYEASSSPSSTDNMLDLFVKCQESLNALAASNLAWRKLAESLLILLTPVNASLEQ